MFVKSGDYTIVRGYHSPDGLYEYSFWLKGQLVGSTYTTPDADPIQLLDSWLHWADEQNIAH